jgi:hypothetical protein
MTTLSFLLFWLNFSPILFYLWYHKSQTTRSLFLLRLSCLVSFTVFYFVYNNIKPESLYVNYDPKNFGMRGIINDLIFIRFFLMIPVFFISDKLFDFKK